MWFRAGSTIWRTSSATTVTQFVHKTTQPGWNLAQCPYAPSQVPHTACVALGSTCLSIPQKAVRVLGWPYQELHQTGPHIYTSGDTSKKCYTYSYRDTPDWKQKTGPSFNWGGVRLQGHLSLVVRPSCESEKGSPVPASMVWQRRVSQIFLSALPSLRLTCTIVPGGSIYMSL